MAYTAENAPYKTPAKRNFEDVVVPKGGQRASYTPDSSINEHGYGKDGGKANLQKGSVPSVVVGGASEVAVLPKLPGGNFRVGEDKNVSTPVSG